MQDTELYQAILGLALPWTISKMDLDTTAQEIRIHVDHPRGTNVKCPDCERKLPSYDHARKTNVSVSRLTKGPAAKQGVGASDLHRTMPFPQAQDVYDIVAEALLNAHARGRIPVSALKGYDILDICRAFKLHIANEFLVLVGRDDFEQRFTESVELL